MSKKETKTPVKPKKEIKLPQGKKKHHYFPRLMFLFSIIFISISIVSYFKLFVTPRIVIEIALFIAGLWMFKYSVMKGFSKRHREIIKRFI